MTTQVQRPHWLNNTMEYVIKQIKTLENLHPIQKQVLAKSWWCKQIYHICTPSKFIHVPIVLFVFLVNVHIQTMWKHFQNKIVQNVIKLCSVCMHLISTNITVLLKDIHVKFVKKITLDSLMLINIWKLMPLSETHSLVTGVHVNF